MWKIACIALLVIVVGISLGGWWFQEYAFAPTDSDLTQGVSSLENTRTQNTSLTDQAATTDNTTSTNAYTGSVSVVAQDLSVPWGLAFLPTAEPNNSSQLLVTERPGTIRLLSLPSGEVLETIEVPNVNASGEGGLLGIALHPSFRANRQLYLYQTYDQPGAGTSNQVVRYHLSETNQLTDATVIIDSIPGASYHDGGRIAFGPDGLLYITTGDAGQAQSAQDPTTLGGSILRLAADGSIPADNPFGNAVYSYGHRNPQGLAWDGAGRLWSTEHGRSGLRSGLDELNLITSGSNYGWPTIEGDATQSGMQAPVVHSGVADTWAPASAAYFNNSVWFAGLRGETLYEAKLTATGDVSEVIAHLRSEYGRLRTVTMGPDGHLYLTTSNTDGRGTSKSGDDKLLRINPAVFVE